MLGLVIEPAVPAILEWISEQGFNPNEISRNVILDDDGSVILERYVLNEGGHVQMHPSDEGRAWKVPVRVANPTRAFPGTGIDVADASLRTTKRLPGAVA